MINLKFSFISHDTGQYVLELINEFVQLVLPSLYFLVHYLFSSDPPLLYYKTYTLSITKCTNKYTVHDT